MRFLKFPTMVGWSITEICNLTCVYCSQSAGRARPDELTTQEALDVVDQIARHRASVIGFTGGEPFLRPDFEQIASRALRHGLRCVVTTNATRLRKIPRSFLVKFIKIRISLDSPVAALHDTARGRPGNFDNVIDGIRRVQRLGIKIEIVSTIGRHNAQHLDEMLYFLEDLRVPEWSVSVLMPTGRGAEQQSYCFDPDSYRDVATRLTRLKARSRLHLKADIPQNVLLKPELRDNPGEHYCSAATDLMVIFPDGSVGPCFTVPLTAGNIRKDELYDIWNDSELFRSFRDKSLLRANCGDCELAGKCGGCRAHAYARTGQLLFGDPLCWHRPLAPYLGPALAGTQDTCPR